MSGAHVRTSAGGRWGGEANIPVLRAQPENPAFSFLSYWDGGKRKNGALETKKIRRGTDRVDGGDLGADSNMHFERAQGSKVMGRKNTVQ
jgi:hypothetical protein